MFAKCHLFEIWILLKVVYTFYKGKVWIHLSESQHSLLRNDSILTWLYACKIDHWTFYLILDIYVSRQNDNPSKLFFKNILIVEWWGDFYELNLKILSPIEDVMWSVPSKGSPASSVRMVLVLFTFLL